MNQKLSGIACGFHLRIYKRPRRGGTTITDRRVRRLDAPRRCRPAAGLIAACHRRASARLTAMTTPNPDINTAACRPDASAEPGAAWRTNWATAIALFRQVSQDWRQPCGRGASVGAMTPPNDATWV